MCEWDEAQNGFCFRRHTRCPHRVQLKNQNLSGVNCRWWQRRVAVCWIQNLNFVRKESAVRQGRSVVCVCVLPLCSMSSHQFDAVGTTLMTSLCVTRNCWLGSISRMSFTVLIFYFVFFVTRIRSRAMQSPIVIILCVLWSRSRSAANACC